MNSCLIEINARLFSRQYGKMSLTFVLCIVYCDKVHINNMKCTTYHYRP